MKVQRSFLVSLVFLLILVGVAVWLYPRLPAEMPTHWNMQGQVNGYLPRFWGVALFPVTIVFLAVLMWLLPVISPRRFEMAAFAHVYTLLMLAAQGLALVLGVAMLLAAAGYAVPIPTIAMLGVGVFFMLLGNYLGKLRKNFFIGIRTPWTLASDAVWERTHRLGGWLFMLAGALAIVTTLIAAPPWVPIAILAVAALIPLVYSFVIYKRLPADD